MRSPIRILWTFLLVGLCAWPISTAAELNWEEPPEEVSEMDIVHYDLTVEVKPESHTLLVDAIVQFKIVGEDKGWVCFTLPGEIFSVKDHAGKLFEYQQVAGELYMETGSLTDEDGLFEVAISFSRVVTGRGARVWEQVSTEGTYVRSVTGWYPRGEDGDRATADFKFIAPEGETAVTCGAYQGEVALEDGRTAQAWSTDMPIASIGFACGRYVVSEISNEGFALLSYLYEEDADRAEEYLELCSEALSLYSDLFGSYPYAKFAVVEIPEGYGGGMGNQSFIMLYEGGFKGKPNEEFWSHEISHNWWAHYVSMDHTYGSWLAEGLAVYSSMLFFEHKYGKRVFLEELRGVAENYLIQAESGSDMPLRYASDTIVAYFKGAYFFHMLRYVVGDEAFFGILQKLVAEYGGGEPIDPQILQEVSEAVAGADLEWFFTQWLDRTGAPRYEVVWESRQLAEGGYEVSGTVLQTEGDFRMPVEVRAISGEAGVTEQVLVEGEETPFSFRVDWEPQEVVLDPDCRVLWYNPYHEKMSQVMEYQNAGNQLWSQHNYQGAIEQFQAALTLELGDQIKGVLLHSVGRCLYELNRYDEAFDTLQEALPLLPGAHWTTAWSRATLGYIYLERGEHEKAGEEFEAVIAMNATANSVAWAQEGLYLARGETPPPEIALASYAMDDDADGNGNGYLDPGERIGLSVSLKNTGGSPATGLEGVLRSGDSHIAVVDSVMRFPDLAPESEDEGESRFVFEISKYYETGTVVAFDLILSDAGEHTWTLHVQLGGPVTVEELIVQDGGTNWERHGMGNMDGVINPGEFITFTPLLRNLTSKEIPSPVIKGAVDDPYVRRGLVAWGRHTSDVPIAPYDTVRATGVQGAGGFSVSPETPDGYIFRVDLEITVEWTIYSTPFYFTVSGSGRALAPYVEEAKPLGHVKPGEPLILKGKFASDANSAYSAKVFLVRGFLIYDADGVAWAKANFYSFDSVLIESVPMEFEGNTFQCTWTPPSEAVFYYTITAADNLGNEMKSRPSTPFSSMSTFPREHPLLVVRVWDTLSGGEETTQETEAILRDAGIRHDLWDTAKLTKLGESDLTPYDPQNPGVLLSPDLQPSVEGRVVLDDYLDCGGKLLLQRVPKHFLDYFPEGRALFSDYLHIFIGEEPDIPRTIQGVEGDPIGEGLRFTVTEYQELIVEPPAVPILTTAAGRPVAVRIEDKGYKAVYFGFFLDAISEWAVDAYDLELDDTQEAGARAQLLLRALQWLDSSVTEVEAASHTQAVPKVFVMSPNFPNPFNPTTEIRYALPEAKQVQLSVFNLLGQEIRVLAEGFREPGTYRVRWDGKDQHGLEAAAGVYVVRLEAGEFSETRRMALVK